MAGPGDEIAAGTGDRGRLRTSYADREQVIEVLKAAFVHGRLDRDEFDLRVGRAFASRTYADLAALTADIPTRLARARPPEPARESVNKKRKLSRRCLRDPRAPEPDGRNAAASGRVTFCGIGHRALVRLGRGRGRVDRLACAVARPA